MHRHHRGTLATITKFGRGKEVASPNRPIVAESIEYIGGIPGRLKQQGQTTRAKLYSLGVAGRPWCDDETRG